MNEKEIKQIVCDIAENVRQTNWKSLTDSLENLNQSRQNDSSKITDLYFSTLNHIYNDIACIVGESISRFLSDKQNQ